MTPAPTQLLHKVIISAMPIETAAILEHAVEIKKVDLATVSYHVAKVGTEFCAIFTSGIGQGYAAATTMLAIHLFNPAYLIFVGIAGTPHTHLTVGDVILGERVFSADLLRFTEAGELIQPDCKHGDQPPAYIDAEQLSQQQLQKLSFSNFSVTQGMVATSDQFPLSPSMPVKLENKSVDAVDMESFAFAQICHKFNKPFSIVRGLSNYVKIGNAERFKIAPDAIQLASDNAAKVAAKLIDLI